MEREEEGDCRYWFRLCDGQSQSTIDNFFVRLKGAPARPTILRLNTGGRQPAIGLAGAGNPSLRP